jgi:hypothetical protein
MHAVLLILAEHVELDAGPDTGVDRYAAWCQVERHLDEAAVVLKADVAAEAKGGAPGDHLAGQRPTGNAAHDPVGQELPVAACRRRRRVAVEVVDDSVGGHGVSRTRPPGGDDRYATFWLISMRL